MSSTSLQQPQQPGLVYPNTVTGQPPPVSPSSHSNGSFGTVFIVLAVIIVISAIACCLGRLCNRRHHRSHSHKEKPSKQIRPKERPDAGRRPGAGRDLEFGPDAERNPSFRPRERENTELEFGFDKNIAASKPAGNGESRGFKQFNNGFVPKVVNFGEPKDSA